MPETYRLAGEEESCEAAHQMRDELGKQLKASRRASRLKLKLALLPEEEAEPKPGPASSEPR
jgi:hypothetical protein